MDEALESLTNVEPGDCIVCFNKQVTPSRVSDFVYVSRRTESDYTGVSVSVLVALPGPPLCDSLSVLTHLSVLKYG